jgi:hypothetical protein
MTVSASINAGSTFPIAYSASGTNPTYALGCLIIPANASYAVTTSSGALVAWTELR